MTSIACRAMGLVLMAALLGGCVSFQYAPVAEMGCDPELIGEWRPDDSEAAAENPSLRLREGCLFEDEKDGRPTLMPISTFAFEGERYIAVAADDDYTVYDSQGGVREVWPKTRVELYRYRIERDRLMLWSADVDTADTLEGYGVTLHSDAAIDPKTNRPMPRKIQNSVYISGERENIAALLRGHGDALFHDMSMPQATVMSRIVERKTP